MKKKMSRVNTVQRRLQRLSVSRRVRPKPATPLHITNIVATERLCHAVDVNAFVAQTTYPHISYHPDAYSGVVLRNMPGSVMVFRTGSVVYTACTKVSELEQASTHVKQLVQPFSTTAMEPSPLRVSHITATEAVGRRIDLPALAAGVSGAEYRPERCRGLILRDMPAMVYIRGNGSIVYCNCKRELEVDLCHINTRVTIQPYLVQ